jgi:hypothetical protein
VAFQVGYLVELSSLKFDEGNDDTMTSTFMAMPYGEYTHPVYGKINFTPEVATEAANHIARRTRGQDLDIDYDHKQYSGEAAGWVKGAQVRSNGLWLTVDWTKKAWQSIKDKAYRYFSPEFADEWKHPKTGEVHKNILFGGGITNRPFLKDILPLNMSELSLAEGQAKEGKGMDPKKLRKLLGLPEDATDEQCNEALSKLPDGAVVQLPKAEDDDKGEDKGKKEEDEDKPVEDQPQTIAASEFVTPEIIKLAEGNAAATALLGVVAKLGETVTKTTAALHLSETANKVKTLSEVGKDQVLSAGAQKLLSEAMLNPTQATIEKLVKGFEVVQLGERGGAANHNDGDGTDGAKKFNDAVQKVIEQDKVDYGTAVERVAAAQPELFEEYRQQAYAFREN